MMQENYSSPEVKVLLVNVEEGFATSEIKQMNNMDWGEGNDDFWY